MNLTARRRFTVLSGTTISALTILATSGCGGGGGSTGSTPSGTPTPVVSYSGNYNGTFTSTADSGSVQFTVDNSSKLTGTIKFNSKPTAIAISGTISSQGILNVGYIYNQHDYSIGGILQQSPITPSSYSSLLTIKDTTANITYPTAALNVARS